MSDQNGDPSVSPFDSNDMMALLRHALTVLGGVLVTDGVLSSSQAQNLVGALCIIIGVAWSIWNKRGHKKLAAALAKLKLDSLTPLDLTTPAPQKKDS